MARWRLKPLHHRLLGMHHCSVKLLAGTVADQASLAFGEGRAACFVHGATVGHHMVLGRLGVVAREAGRADG